MKILITTDCYQPVINGVVTSIINLNKELIKNGHDVRILTLSHDNQSSHIKNVYYIKSIDVGRIYPNARASFPFRHPYIQELIEWRPDVIHTQSEFTSFICARRISAKTGAPMVHTYHTVYEDYTHYFTSYPSVGKKAVAVSSRRLLNKTAAVIAPTQKVRELLCSYGVAGDIFTIPTGIDLKPYYERLSDRQRSQMRYALGIVPEDKVLVTVGRLAKEKNIEELLEHMKRLLTIRQDVKLLIVGDGPNRNNLTRLSGELGLGAKVIFTGMVAPEEVSKYYQLGDIFVSASNSETQGLTYIEALASGLPAVCREDECLNGVLKEGYNGFTFTSFEWFLQGIEYILADEKRYNQIRENAVCTAGRFSSSEFAGQAQQVYESVVSKEGNYEYDKYAVKGRHGTGAWGLIRTR